MIKSLRAQRDAASKQITALEAALAAQESTQIKRKKRNRPKAQETVDLERRVVGMFQRDGSETLKLIDVLRGVIESYPEAQRLSEDEMRGRFQNLKKSGFIASVDQPYGHIKLVKK